VPGPEAEPDQDEDADEVVDDGCPRDGDEAAARVEQSGPEREEAVGGDLDDEPPQKGGGDLAFELDPLGIGGLGVAVERGQRVDGCRAQRRARRWW